MSLTLTVVSDFTWLENQGAEWLSLLERSAANHPTLTPDWLSTWWSVFGSLQGRHLRVGLFQAEGRLVGIAPFLSRKFWYRRSVPFRRLEFLGSGEAEADEICSDYLSIIVEQGFEQSVARALARAVVWGDFGKCDEIVLPAMDASTPMPRALLAEFAQRGLMTELRESAVCPYIPLPRSWDEYLSLLSGSHRYLVRRSMRDFERFSGGDHQVERVTCREDLARGIEILHKLHDERWGAARPAGAFGSDRFSRFHEAVIPKLFERGALDLCWLSVRGEPISVLYNIVHAGRLYFYQSGRSLLLPKGVRPGIVLHAHAIARAIESGLSEYDFLAGPSRYKLELALATRPLVTLRAARPSAVEAARRLTELGIAGARRLKRGMHEAAQGDWARARAALIGTHEMTTPALIKVNSEPAARHSSSGPAPSAGSASAGAAGAVRKQASDGKARGGASKMPVPPRVHASEPESTERGSPGLAIDHAHLQPGG